MGTYVVGDIHGCFDEWIELKNKIEKEDKQACFILLGDIIDRGPKSQEMLDWAMTNVTQKGKYQMIRGNHEQVKLEKIQQQKGEITDQEKKMSLFFNQLPFYKELDIGITPSQHYIIVHGGLPRDCRDEHEMFLKESLLLPENQLNLLWMRDSYSHGCQSTIVLHGHTPTLFEVMNNGHRVSGMIHYNTRDINLDCGMAYHPHYTDGNLAALRLEDLKEYYSLEISPQKSKTIAYKLNQNIRAKLRSSLIIQ